jgi:hypothetical protein
MTTLTGFVASVVVHSSAAAFAHFGLNVEPMHAQKTTPVQSAHVIARTPPAPQKVADCPAHAARVPIARI